VATFRAEGAADQEEEHPPLPLLPSRAGVECRADDGAGGQPTDLASGEPRGSLPEPAAAGPPSGALRWVAVRARGRRRVALAVVVGVVVVLPARLRGTLRAPEHRDGHHGCRPDHSEEQDLHRTERGGGCGAVQRGRGSADR
jgi:hypothetical protein